MSESDEDMQVHVTPAAQMMVAAVSGESAVRAAKAAALAEAEAHSAVVAMDGVAPTGQAGGPVSAAAVKKDKARRLARGLSPEREGRSYARVLKEAQLAREDAQIRARIAEIELANAAAPTPAPSSSSSSSTTTSAMSTTTAATADAAGTETRKRRRPSRWGNRDKAAGAAVEAAAVDTGVGAGGEGAGAGAEAGAGAGARVGEQGAAVKKVKRSRWDTAPTAAAGADPRGADGSGGKTGAAGGTAADLASEVSPWTDAQLDALLPSAGYEILEPPPGYVKAHPGAFATSRVASQAAVSGTDAYVMPAASGTVSKEAYGVTEGMTGDVDGTTGAPGGVALKPDDLEYFASVLGDDGGAGGGEAGSGLSTAEQKERTILRLLLKIKNGTAAQRKSSLRTLVDRAEEFGAGALFSQILPLFLAPSLEDGERHLLVKVIDRVLYKVRDGVQPYVHKILVVIEPLLVDEDKFARIEGREVISNLAKAAGLPCMIANMRPDINHADPVVRDVTAKAFAVVAVALGVPVLLPFLTAVCGSGSWEARHTGAKIVQQIAILQGVGVLPYLHALVGIVGPAIQDTQHLVRNVGALALAALAEASAPYGIDAFDSVLEPLWSGVKVYSGRALAAFLKAVGYIIPLMEPEHANHYTREVMDVLLRHFATTLEDMKLVVLKVVQQVVGADGVPADYVAGEVVPEFFEHMWVRRNALDRRAFHHLVQTSVVLAEKIGAGPLLEHVVAHLKDESEPFRKLAVESVSRVLASCGLDGVTERLEERLIDGLTLAFQDQSTHDKVFLRGMCDFIKAMGPRIKPYLQPIFATIQWRLNNADPMTRQQAADLVASIAPVVIAADEEVRLARMAVILYENLGEEYPEVLGSILSALHAIVSVIGMSKMTPPIRDLLPRLTPILRNRHEKVQEHCIYLVGKIADRGARYVSGREWMRICFQLLDLLKATRKPTRAAAVSTFGFIAKAIGPQDVLATLLANLKVQDRQNRVCTTVAIAIVAETCSPFTVLPALMNEYRVPELNVQNGVLKSLAFLFEYIGETGADYAPAVTTLLVDALTDRDVVHRQTAAVVVKHLATNVAGRSREDIVVHLLNHVIPVCLSQSPHEINAVMDAIFAARFALGPARLVLYALQGLFHPARSVRTVYWRIYNDAYVACPEAALPAQPAFEDLDPRAAVPELDYLL